MVSENLIFLGFLENITFLCYMENLMFLCFLLIFSVQDSAGNYS